MPNVTRLPMIDGARGRTTVTVIEETPAERELHKSLKSAAAAIRAQVGPAAASRLAVHLLLGAAFDAHTNPMPEPLAGAMAEAVDAASKLHVAIERLVGWDISPPKGGRRAKSARRR